MENPRIGSLNSLVDYPLSESDIEDSDDEVESKVSEDPAAATSNAIAIPQLPPEPASRCSNKLQNKILENIGLDINSVQKTRKFRNPSLYERLVSKYNIDETGSNYPKSPTCWTEESYYGNLAKAQIKAYKRKKKEKAIQARTQVEFVSGIKKPVPGEKTKKRTSKWDASSAPGQTGDASNRRWSPIWDEVSPLWPKSQRSCHDSEKR
ncbi:hypothetical protein ACROYT_G017276 [Oculina patagonica]